MIRCLRVRATRGADRRGDDAGMAMIYTVLFMLVLSTFSATALASLTEQVRQTNFTRKHEQTLNTGLAGLQAGLNRIRAAVDATTGVGVVGSLPCQSGTHTGTVTGSVDAAAALTYTTTIYYLTSDPLGMSQAQVSAAAMSCPLSTVPSYAYLVSTGDQAALPHDPTAYGDRTVHAVYALSIGTSAIPGGQIMTTNSLCWDAGASPAVGTTPTLATCGAPATASQSWYFRRDLSIQWMGTPSANLCLDYRGVAASPVSYLMTLQTCLGAGTIGTAYDSLNQRYPVAGQLYQEFTQTNWLQAVSTTGDQNTAYVASSQTPGSGQYEQFLAGDLLVMNPNYTRTSYVTLASAVGAGGTAGVTNGTPSFSEQMVNLAYAQDCLDVAGAYPPNGLIHFPCHEAPDPEKIAGNQRFQYSGTTSVAGTLTSVSSSATPDASHYYSLVCAQSDGSTVVALVTCNGGASQQWQLTGYRFGDYPDSYEIEDYTGQCITATNGYTTQLLPCNGGNAQKWNAPPVATTSQIGEVEEQ